METISDSIRKTLNLIEEADYAALLGEKIGEGSRREVYAHASDDSLVVKVQVDLGNEQNKRENAYWRELQNSAFAEWFAPVMDMSPDTKYLVMQKSAPGWDGSSIPLLLMFFDAWNFGDTDSNLGNIGSQTVCHDYGLCFAPIETLLGAELHDQMSRMLRDEEVEEIGRRIYFEDGFPNGYYSAENVDWILGMV